MFALTSRDCPYTNPAASSFGSSVVAVAELYTVPRLPMRIA
jgi:hypothetical protein